MEIESNLRSTKKERVPVFVVSTDDDGLKFYAFHEFICPTFEHTRFHNKDSVKELARPFTGFTSNPMGCAFASVGDQFYLIGGTKQSYQEWMDSDYQDPPFPGESHVSCRVKRFDCQSFVNSLADTKDEGKIKKFAELDGNEVSNEYWETCAPLCVGRREASLLHLRGRLYAVGGIFRFEDDIDYTNAPLIEEFKDGVWTPLITQDTPDIDPYVLISVALEDSNKILIGSRGSFYELNVGTAQWKKLAGVVCSNPFLVVCAGTPGLYVGNRFVMWFDHIALCIRGLDLLHNKYFYVDIIRYAVDLKPKHQYQAQSAQIIDMEDKEGSLCLIFYYSTDHCFKEYRCVTFQIIFNKDKLDNLAAENEPFPGVELETKVISRRKCFTLFEGTLVAAFTMDVCFPREEAAPTRDIGEASEAD